MTDKELAVTKEWIANWRENGPIIERLRVKEYRVSDLAETLLSLSDVTEASLRAHPPKPTSGIIEMQRLFSKLWDKEADTLRENEVYTR